MGKEETSQWESVVSQQKPFWIEEFDKFLLETLSNIDEYGTGTLTLIEHYKVNDALQRASRTFYVKLSQ